MYHNPQQARNRYQALDLNSKMASASPHSLVAILYEELEKALDVARRALETGQEPTVTHQLGRARSILIALESGLDFDRGGALAHTLATVYKSMQSRLAKAGQSIEGLDEVRSGVADIAGSWRSLVVKPN